VVTCGSVRAGAGIGALGSLDPSHQPRCQSSTTLPTRLPSATPDTSHDTNPQITGLRQRRLPTGGTSREGAAGWLGRPSGALDLADRLQPPGSSFRLPRTAVRLFVRSASDLPRAVGHLRRNAAEWRCPAHSWAFNAPDGACVQHSGRHCASSRASGAGRQSDDHRECGWRPRLGRPVSRQFHRHR